MRCHSKSKCGIQQCHVNVEVKKSKIPRKKRSLGRYKIKNTCCSNNSSWSNMNVSSSVTDVDEELKDIVSSLLMLAKGGFYSVDHFSDDGDDSVKIEHRFAIDNAVNVRKELGSNVNSGNDVNDDCVNERALVVESGIKFDVLRSEYDSFNETTKEFHGFDDALSKERTENVQYGPVTDVGLRFEVYNAGIRDGAVGDGKVDTRFCACASEETKCCNNEVHDRVFDRSNSRTCGLTLVANRDNDGSVPAVNVEHESELFDAETMDKARGGFQEDTVVESLSLKNSTPLAEERKSEKCNSETSEPIADSCCLNQSHDYICRICNKSFLSPQALGSHRLHFLHYKRFCRSGIKVRTKATLGEESGCKSVELQCVKEEMIISDTNKKRWRHKCMVCDRTFPTGQALGGHMRAYFNGNVQSHKIDSDASDKEILAAVGEERKEEDHAYDEKFSGAVTKERKQENDSCSTEVQQLFKEREIVIKPQGNIPLLV